MRPTQDTMQSVLGNAALLEGFDDPEVMRAVSDVAANPQNINKYKDNKKVWSRPCMSVICKASAKQSCSCCACLCCQQGSLAPVTGMTIAYEYFAELARSPLP